MEVFGPRWSNYVQRLQTNWSAVVTAEDSVVIPGDISWALTLPQARSDLHFLDALPGHKYIGKGNHDFWWSTAAKMEQFFKAENIHTISLLNNNAWDCEDFILCGTRGWYQDPTCDNMPPHTDCTKLIAREAIRLRISLEAGQKLQAAAPHKEMLVFLHFPPLWNDLRCEALISLLQEFHIRRCYFGHIHGNYTAPRSFVDNGILYSLIAADHLAFAPRPILPDYEI